VDVERHYPALFAAVDGEDLALGDDRLLFWEGDLCRGLAFADDGAPAGYFGGPGVARLKRARRPASTLKLTSPGVDPIRVEAGLFGFRARRDGREAIDG